MSSEKPTVIFVHGAYHPPACYEGVISRLRAAGLEVVTPRLVSLGKDSFGATHDEDVSVVREVAGPLLAAGKDLVLVGHSYGGLVALSAVGAGLGAGDGPARGQLRAMVYLCATLPTKRGGNAMDACNPVIGVPPTVMELYDMQVADGKATTSIKSNETSTRFYFDPVPQEEIPKARALLDHQCPDVFSAPISTMATDISVPQTYVICEKDQMVPLAHQEEIVASNGIASERLVDSSHSCHLSHPQQVVEIIVKAASR